MRSCRLLVHQKVGSCSAFGLYGFQLGVVLVCLLFPLTALALLVTVFGSGNTSKDASSLSEVRWHWHPKMSFGCGSIQTTSLGVTCGIHSFSLYPPAD